LVHYVGNGSSNEFRGNLFSAQHNSRKVARHVLTRAGSTFIAESHDFVWSDDPDFHPSDVLEDADGSLLVVDTGGWYVEHCPTGKINKSGARGGLWRVQHGAPGQQQPATKNGRRRSEGPRSVSQRSSPDPRGLQLDWMRPRVNELAARLDDWGPVVREHA